MMNMNKRRLKDGKVHTPPPNIICDNIAKTFGQSMIEKFNPYHDRLGRFTSPGAAASFTYSPGKSKAHDMAIAREKERTKNMGGGAASSGAPAAGTKKVQLNQELVRRANDASMFNRGDITARDAQKEMDSFDEQFKPKADWTDEQKAYAAKRHDEYTELVAEVYNDQLNRSANNPSWMVTGRAGRDMNRAQRDTERQMRAYEEGKGKMERFKENTQKELDRMTPESQQIARWRNGRWSHGETISSDDPLAAKKLQAKLEYQQESQQRMKDANAYYRKNGSMKGYSGYSEKTNANIDAQMADMKARGYSSFARQPFSSSSLTNNNAQIKATQQRLAQQQKIDAARSSSSSSGGSAGGFSFKGGSVVQNTSINRLQIKFDSIPDVTTRNKLKSEGWRWSPKEQAWQRQLTDNAERSAKRILGE